jgi:hypothetical protein
MKLIKIVVVGATAAACQGKKLRGHGKKEVPNRKLGTYYWIPSEQPYQETYQEANKRTDYLDGRCLSDTVTYSQVSYIFKISPN